MKRFAVHDGPGIRTTVFFKGCSLRCVWCHNPEAISPGPEVFFYPDRCIKCGSCVEACPNGAQTLLPSGSRTYERTLCTVAGECVKVCHSDALVMAGRQVSVEDVMARVREDAPFYGASGGGVTLSGGEPLLQNEFAAAVLSRCKSEGFHTAVDTCGQVPWRFFEKALSNVDLVLYDVKQISSEIHKKYTGVANELIIENLRRVCDWGVEVEIRMPIIPTINDSREHIEGAARLLASLDNISAVRLLAYHSLAGSKYHSLGMENGLPVVDSPDAERMGQIAGWMSGYGLSVVAPDAEPTTHKDISLSQARSPHESMIDPSRS